MTDNQTNHDVFTDFMEGYRRANQRGEGCGSFGPELAYVHLWYLEADGKTRRELRIDPKTIGGQLVLGLTAK